MNFINVVVHSAEDMNFRVHLQHEFSLLGLDDFLEVCGNDGGGGGGGGGGGATCLYVHALCI